MQCGPCYNNCMLSYFLKEIFTKAHHKKWEICLTFSTHRHKKATFCSSVAFSWNYINISNTSISKNYHLVLKLSFGISRSICSYLVGSFQNVLEEILTHNFLGIEVGLKLFFICSLEMVVGPLWKDGTYTLQLLLGAPLTA